MEPTTKDSHDDIQEAGLHLHADGELLDIVELASRLPMLKEDIDDMICENYNFGLDHDWTQQKVLVCYQLCHSTSVCLRMSNTSIQLPISPEETETWMDKMILEQDVVEKTKDGIPKKNNGDT